MEERVVQLQTNLYKFIKHVDDLTDEDDPAGNGFYREYRELREKAAQDKEAGTYPATIGREPYNMKKNRYKDIIAYDYSRVVLPDTGVEGSDYINANLIQDPYDNDGYIAAQGPLPHTIDDFWRMIIEYRVKVVIMTCKLIEGNKKKCAEYWPESVGEEEDYGDVNVKMTNENDMKEDCTVRVFEVSCGVESHQVTQYHYTGWPDHGIPEDRDVILAMVAQMRDIRHKDLEKAPILVHCSAGCGRTGTVCAIDYAWEVLRGGKLTGDFTLRKIVETMREQRQSMIQTPDQYEMAHLAVRDLFQKHMEIMEENIYMNYGGDDEEQAALDSLNMVTDSTSSASDSTAKDDDFDVYSYLSATKVLQDSVLDTVNRYTNEEEIPDNSSLPKDKLSPRKPSLPTDKPALPTKDYSSPSDLDKDTKPVVKNKYENVAVTGTLYENMDLVVVDQKQGNSFTPPQLKKKLTPPPSPVKKSGPMFAGKPSDDLASTEKKPDGPLFTRKKADSPPVVTTPPSSVKKSGPVFEGKPSDGLASTEKKPDSPVLAGKKADSRPVVKDIQASSIYSVASEPAVVKPATSGPKFVGSGQAPAHSGPSWSPAPSKPETKPVSTEPLAAKLPKESMLMAQPVQSVKTTNVSSTVATAPANNNGKHVTKILVGTAKPSAPIVKPVTEPNDNLHSVAANSSEQKASGPLFSAGTGGEIYSVVQKDTKAASSSTKRRSQNQPKPTPAMQQDVYSSVSPSTEASFQGHILGGDGSYSEVVIGNPPKMDDNLYSCVAGVPPSSSDAALPEIPSRGYISEPPREPPHRAPAPTVTHNATLNKGSTVDPNHRWKGLITKIVGGTAEHQYTDTSNIKGFHERIGQKPMGKKEEPSRWKKIFKNSK